MRSIHFWGLNRVALLFAIANDGSTACYLQTVCFNRRFTLFRIILGDVDFRTIQETNRFLGPLYFILYVVFVVFIFIGMFLTVINDTYAEVRVELADVKCGFGSGEHSTKVRSHYAYKADDRNRPMQSQWSGIAIV